MVGGGAIRTALTVRGHALTSIPPTSHHEPETNHTERVEAGLHLARVLATRRNRTDSRATAPRVRTERGRRLLIAIERRRDTGRLRLGTRCYTCSNGASTMIVFTGCLYRPILIGDVWRPKQGLLGRVRTAGTCSQSDSLTAERSSRSAFASAPAGARRSKCWRADRPIRTRRPTDPGPDRPSTTKPRTRRRRSVLSSRSTRSRSAPARTGLVRSSAARPFVSARIPVPTLYKELSFHTAYRSRCDPSVGPVAGAGTRTNSTG